MNRTKTKQSPVKCYPNITRESICEKSGPLKPPPEARTHGRDDLTGIIMKQGTGSHTTDGSDFRCARTPPPCHHPTAWLNNNMIVALPLF